METNKSDQQFKRVSEHTIKNFIDAGRNEGAGIRFILGSVFVLVFAFNDVTKLFMRRNYPVNTFTLMRLIVAAIALSVAGIIILTNHELMRDREPLKVSFIIFAWLLIINAAIISFLAIKQRIRFTHHLEAEPYRLDFLIKYGWSESRIEYVAEPLYLILLGLAFAAVNYYGFIPFFACAVAVWLYRLLQLIFPKFFEPQITLRPGANRDDNEFNQVTPV